MARPTGFAAKCLCGNYIGAMDAARTDRAEMGKILGDWLFRGMTVEPRFEGTWSVELRSCQCSEKETRVVPDSCCCPAAPGEDCNLSYAECLRRTEMNR